MYSYHSVFTLEWCSTHIGTYRHLYPYYVHYENFWKYRDCMYVVSCNFASAISLTVSQFAILHF